MAKKGKKSGGKKKGSKKDGKKKAEYLPPVYEIPKYEDPKENTPKIKVTTVLFEPANPLMRIEDQYYIDTKLDIIINQIKQLHQGSVGTIKLTKHKGNFEEVLDNSKTLQQNGFLGNEDVILFYDFKPVCHPLLE